jgi:hypothetical protein
MARSAQAAVGFGVQGQGPWRGGCRGAGVRPLTERPGVTNPEQARALSTPSWRGGCRGAGAPVGNPSRSENQTPRLGKT